MVDGDFLSDDEEDLDQAETDWVLSDLDEESEESFLFDTIDDLLDENEEEDEDADGSRLQELLTAKDTEPEAPSTGRRAMASRVRKARKGPSEEAFGRGYAHGYVHAMKDHGAGPEVLQEAYGRIWTEVQGAARGVTSLAAEASKGFLGGQPLSGVAAEAWSAATGSASPKAFAHQAGVAARQQFSNYLSPAAVAENTSVDDTVVEADALSLPPVYVADEEGFEEDLGEDVATVEFGGTLRIQDRFGAVCRYGFVGSQPRRSARQAAHRAVLVGQKEIFSPSRALPSPFVEDPNADPVLFSDGRIVDAVYGALVPVPCPSCTRLQDRQARHRNDPDHTCLVCGQYGAILVPKGDVSSFVAGTSYGLLPLVTFAAKALTSKALFPEGGKKVFAWLKKGANKLLRPELEVTPEEDVPMEEMDESSLGASEESFPEVAPEASDSYGVVRALVPTRWTARR
jgi:hypothetical protein